MARHSLQRGRRGAVTLIGSIALKLLRMGLLYCELGVLHAIAAGPRYLPRVLSGMAILGTALSCFFELVLRGPDFPFWSAMRLPIGCAALLAIHRAAIAVAANQTSRGTSVEGSRRPGLRPPTAAARPSSLRGGASVDEVESRRAAIYRAMSAAQRLSEAMRMYRQMESLMDAALRAEHPEWTAEQRRLVIARRILYARTG